MADMDFVEEIRIAQYWRRQLGEYEYVYYNPDDLRRWYIALELRGPDEVRSFLSERSSRYPEGPVTGLVTKAPHPPRDIVELWLASHHRPKTRSYWMGLGLFLGLCYVFVPQLHGCIWLKDVNRYATHPPQMQAPVQAGAPASAVPQAPSTLPVQAPPAPASAASPPAASSTQSQGGPPH